MAKQQEFTGRMDSEVLRLFLIQSYESIKTQEQIISLLRKEIDAHNFETPGLGHSESYGDALLASFTGLLMYYQSLINQLEGRRD